MPDNNVNNDETKKTMVIDILMEKLDEGETSAQEYGWLSADEVKSLIEK